MCFLNRPSFFSRTCLIPGGGNFPCLTGAVFRLLSMKALTSVCSLIIASKNNSNVRPASAFEIASKTNSDFSARACSFNLEFNDRIRIDVWMTAARREFWEFSNMSSPIFEAGLNRVGATGMTSMKNMSANEAVDRVGFLTRP